MKSYEISATAESSGFQRPAGAAQPQPADAVPFSAASLTTRNIGGLNWICDNRFAAVLAAVPASAWTDPASAGWQCVKQNSVRRVWRATIGDKSYYLKICRDGGRFAAFKRFLRGPACLGEWNGGMYALRHDIPAARPVGRVNSFNCGGVRASLLVTEAIEPAYPLCDFWQTIAADTDRVRRRRDSNRLIDLLAQMIARAHQAGFEHLDMHAANILVHPLGQRRYRTVFIDLQSAHIDSPLSDQAVIRNLSQLNQWFRRQSSVSERLRFLRAYWRWRNEYEGAFAHSRPLVLTFVELIEALETQADLHAGKLWSQRDRKAMRDGRYFARVKVPGGWRARVFVSAKPRVGEAPPSGPLLDRSTWKRLLAAPLAWFERPGQERLKDSHSAQVTRVLLDTGAAQIPVIVKRPLPRNARRAARQSMPPSRSMRGWRVGNAMLHRDLPTPRPLAVLERRFGPFILDSMLLTEAIPGALDLEAYLRREFGRSSRREWARTKRTLSAMVVRELRMLHERGFEHRDCKAGNLLVAPEPDLRVLWIDMDGLRIVSRRDPRRELTALARLYVSLAEVPGLGRTDFARALRDYLARYGGSRRDWRETWREMQPMIARKVVAKRVRREWKLAHYGRE
ncbi:MAG: lipopolysaccharide kinase InaA family protein [Phycisphaerae bacterium]